MPRLSYSAGQTLPLGRRLEMKLTKEEKEHIKNYERQIIDSTEEMASNLDHNEELLKHIRWCLAEIDCIKNPRKPT